MLILDLANTPIPWAAPKRVKGKFYDIRYLDKLATRRNLHRLYRKDPIKGYVALSFVFYFSPPPSVSKKRREQMLAGEVIPTSCDCTNLQKFYEDCLKNLVITDDRNVAKISSQKLYAENDGIVIKIWTLEEFRNEVSHR